MRRADDNRLSGKRIALLIAVTLVLAFIFGQSMLPKSISVKESSWMTEKVMNPLLKPFGLGPVTDQTVRRSAHVAEFAILSFLLAFSFHGRIVKSAGVGFTAAFLDESIQILSNRGSQISDVWIDLIGIAAGSFAAALIYCVIRRKRNSLRKQGEDNQK